MIKATIRFFVGLAVAPGLPALALYLINLLVVSHQEALLLTAILAMLGYLAALLLGVPAWFILRKTGTSSLLSYLVLGAAIGLVANVLFFGIEALSSWQSYPEHALELLKKSVRAAVVAVSYGSVASGIFWFIAIRRHK